MGAVVDRLRAQQGGRVVDRVAGEVLRRPRVTVQDVVGDDAVGTRAHAGHQANVSRPGRAREHGLHAGGHHAPRGEPAEGGEAGLRVAPVEGGEAIDADDDRALLHGAHGTRRGASPPLRQMPCEPQDGRRLGPARPRRASRKFAPAKPALDRGNRLRRQGRRSNGDHIARASLRQASSIARSDPRDKPHVQRVRRARLAPSGLVWLATYPSTEGTLTPRVGGDPDRHAS